MKDTRQKSILDVLERIVRALERLSPPTTLFQEELRESDAYIWEPRFDRLRPIRAVNRIELDLLVGIDSARDTLLSNTQRFAAGYPANNALLWGARGMGKSSLIKAVHEKVNKQNKDPLILVEIHREDTSTVDRLLEILSKNEQRFILFCDDLSFDNDDTSYKSLKAVLEGGIEGRPKNAIFYATSNRRHLMPRDMIENERSTAISPSETVDEKVSLSDRFGLWLGFHTCNQDEYLKMVNGYIKRFSLGKNTHDLNAAALEWSIARGSRSGRVAWQFIQDIAGQEGKLLE